MNEVIDISGLDKAELLAALYNNSHPQGMGFHQFVPGDMTIEQARDLTNARLSFDYLAGRVMKVDLSGDTLNPGLYDRDCGDGEAARIVALLRGEKGN